MRNLSKWIGIGAFLATTSLLQAQSFDCCQMQCGCESDSNSRFYVEGDLLVWKPTVHGIPLGATTISNGTTLDNTTGSCTRVNNFDFKWKAGFRVGLGYNLPCTGDTKIIYTRFTSNAKAHACVPESVLGSFQPSYGAPIPFASEVGTTTSAFGQWRLQLNLLDFKLEKKLCFNNFNFTPFVGVRGAWIQHRYNFTVSNSNPADTQDAETFCSRHRFEGAGLRSGIESEYNICNGFGVYGFGAGSIVYGRHTFKAFEVFFDPGLGRDINSSLNDHYFDSQAMFDWGLGIQWRTSLCSDRFGFTLQAGWEQNIFFNNVRFDQFLGNSQIEEHNLNLQGFTLSAQLDF